MSVAHTSRIRLEKHEGPHRTAHVEQFDEPSRHLAIAESRLRMQDLQEPDDLLGVLPVI